MADVFTTRGTVGIEEEFTIVDPDTLEPQPASDTLLDNPPGRLAEHLDVELFKCVLETKSPIIKDVDDAAAEIQERRQMFCEYASENGYAVAAAGLYPGARWRRLEHVKKPRYAKQLDAIRYPQHRNLTAGLHVHIGMDDPDRAVRVADAVREHLPLLLACSANSPFWNGYDTGLASARAVIFENLPNTGIPTAFNDFETFNGFERMMLDTGSIRDRGALWYDIRPHTAYGTVEVRAPDTQIEGERVVAFVHLIHRLVTHLAERIEAGEEPADVRHELLQQNKWRAARHGHDADLIKAGKPVPLGRQLETLADTISLQNRHVDALLEPSGAAQQRAGFEQDGLRGACRSTVLG